MGCAASLASLDLLEAQETTNRIARISILHSSFAKTLKKQQGIKNIRQQGTILAFDIVTNQEDGYFNDIKEQLYNGFLSEGIILRPLGNTIYIMPPYCITDAELERVYVAILNVIQRTIHE